MFAETVKELGLSEGEGLFLCALKLKGIIGGGYRPDERVKSSVRWDDICNVCNHDRPFKKTKRFLCNMEYLDAHGKSMKPVCSLTNDGALLASYLIDMIRNGDDVRLNEFLDKIDPNNWN